MRIQTMADVVPISITLTQGLLHNTSIIITYAKTSNFRMEPIGFIPLYFVAMPQSMITVIEVPFVLAQVHSVVSIKSKPQTPRGTELVS